MPNKKTATEALLGLKKIFKCPLQTSSLPSNKKETPSSRSCEKLNHTIETHSVMIDFLECIEPKTQNY